jgi:hypothetical protein
MQDDDAWLVNASYDGVIGWGVATYPVLTSALQAVLSDRQQPYYEHEVIAA